MRTEGRREGQAGTAGLNRRDVLAGATILAGATLAAVGNAAEKHEHSAAAAGAAVAQHHYSEARAFKKHASLVAVTNECIAKGQACLSHCFETFVAGDTAMAECARAVHEMIATCQAFALLAANDSVVLRPMAQACIAVCEECEKQCRVHEEHQPECRACADACKDLVTEAKKLLS